MHNITFIYQHKYVNNMNGKSESFTIYAIFNYSINQKTIWISCTNRKLLHLGVKIDFFMLYFYQFCLEENLDSLASVFS